MHLLPLNPYPIPITITVPITLTLETLWTREVPIILSAIFHYLHMSSTVFHCPQIIIHHLLLPHTLFTIYHYPLFCLISFITSLCRQLYFITPICRSPSTITPIFARYLSLSLTLSIVMMSSSSIISH